MKKYLVGLVFTFITLQAEAANHFVRQGATGSANGNDWANAYTSLPDILVRGDTYYIAAGSYPGRSFGTPTSGTTLITIKKAIEADHGTETGWQASYGTGQAAFTGMLEFTSSYWLFDGQTGGGAANNWNQNLGFKITETGDSNAIIRIGYSAVINDITIRHVEFQGKGSVSTQGGGYSNDAMAIYQAKNITLSYYWMHGVGRCPFFTGGQNVLAEQGWVQSYFQSSTVHSEVASIWQISSGTLGDHTFRNNLITDIEGTGGLMWDNSSNPAAHMYVYGNVFYKPAGASWMTENGVIGGWTTSASSFINVSVYNNTFINVDQESLSTFPTVYANNVAYNNLFFNCASPDFSRFATHDYNYFINSGGTASEPHGTSATSGDPFVNYVGLDFRLNVDTLAGLSLFSPYNVDPLGAIRGVSGIFDRGAFQFQGNGGGSTILLAPTNLRIQ
ncbi:MAG: hypothetical protein ACXWRU_16645 [Pseudobdellovibrionaceae bacterium]